MAELSQLEQVQLDAKRITLERIEAEKKAKAWQESKKGGVSLDESVEAAKIEPVQEEEVKAPKKAVKKKEAK